MAAIEDAGPCLPSAMSLVNKRIVVMEGRDPVSVHDTLDSAMADIGKRASSVLLECRHCEANALYFKAVDR